MSLFSQSISLVALILLFFFLNRNTSDSRHVLQEECVLNTELLIHLFFFYAGACFEVMYFMKKLDSTFLLALFSLLFEILSNEV